MTAVPDPLISTVILSYNRVDLLRRTVDSYLATASVPHELFIVDNASAQECLDYLRDLEERLLGVRVLYLPENIGGEGFNKGLELSRGRYLHMSENDLEYRPGWDLNLLGKFEAFPELGQLCLMSPFPELEEGEVWEVHPGTPVTRGNQTIFRSDNNVTTNSIIRRACWDAGFRWHNLAGLEGSAFLFPDDGRASREIVAQGYWIAWNDSYVVLNLGHTIEEFIQRVDYYVENYRVKGWFGLEGWKKRLIAHGYDLVPHGDSYKIVKL